jgi:hypothetical protein
MVESRRCSGNTLRTRPGDHTGPKRKRGFRPLSPALRATSSGGVTRNRTRPAFVLYIRRGALRTKGYGNRLTQLRPPRFLLDHGPHWRDQRGLTRRVRLFDRQPEIGPAARPNRPRTGLRRLPQMHRHPVAVVVPHSAPRPERPKQISPGHRPGFTLGLRPPRRFQSPGTHIFLVQSLDAD